MADTREDQWLTDTLKAQRELVQLYRQAAKKSPDRQCRAMYKGLESDLESQVEAVAKEMARHRMERGLGNVIEHAS